jgi:hypothetical protein
MYLKLYLNTVHYSLGGMGCAGEAVRVVLVTCCLACNEVLEVVPQHAALQPGRHGMRR